MMNERPRATAGGCYPAPAGSGPMWRSGASWPKVIHWAGQTQAARSGQYPISGESRTTARTAS